MYSKKKECWRRKKHKKYQGQIEVACDAACLRYPAFTGFLSDEFFTGLCLMGPSQVYVWWVLHRFMSEEFFIGLCLMGPSQVYVWRVFHRFMSDGPFTGLCLMSSSQVYVWRVLHRFMSDGPFITGLCLMGPSQVYVWWALHRLSSDERQLPKSNMNTFFYYIFVTFFGCTVKDPTSL